MSIPGKDFRPLTGVEAAIIERLLGHDFVGRVELLQQLVGLEASAIDGSGSLWLKATHGERAPIRSTPAVEARYPDLDASDEFGSCVNVLLHVKEGYLSMLEMYKDDGSKIMRVTVPEDCWMFSRHAV